MPPATITRLLPRRRITGAVKNVATNPARFPTIITTPIAPIERCAWSRMSGRRARYVE
jgi:hypothetical protein